MRADRLICALVLGLWAGALGRDAADQWIDATVLPTLIHATSAEVRDRNGTLLRAYTVDDGRWRMALSLDRVDPLFVRMLLAFEDRRFASHSGVDPRAMLRATAQALWHGRIVSGGSTLTMQVARLLESSGTGAWAGKLRQIRLALAIERHLSKDAILSLYLHLAPYGGNVEGLRAATLTWFGKEPRHLTPAEAALLVALPQSPEARRPDRHPNRARTARDRVLARMVRAGVLNADAAQAATRDPAPKARRPMPMLAPHLSDLVVATAGGRHDLTLDGDLQQRLETLAARHMTGRDPALSLAIVVADHRTGEVLASVGSPAYDNGDGQGFVDMTRALRSPGSTLKPLVYGLAFDRGLAHPETLIRDTPVQFKGYAPQNFDGTFMGEMRVSEALQTSRNIPVVRLTQALGPAHVLDALRRARTEPVLPAGAPGLAISLGGLGVTLTDLVSLYAMLAQGGAATPLHWLSDSGGAPRDQVLSPRAAWQVGHILAGITPPPASGPRGRVAFKTGTSYGHRDTWAIGFDGAYVVGVWMGRPDGTPVPGAFGGDVAAPLLFEVLGRTRADPVPLPPPPPDTLMVSNAALPLPLQRFRENGENDVPTLDLRFPPEGARLALEDGAVPIKLRGGTPPYSVLANGALVASGIQRPDFLVPLAGAGFATLSVIDATGASGRVSIEVR
ncbi:penicillin-binding protein 1C [Puniceibacterium sp. IMCC21224]|uniref:penicillin-binding protein 1C n=1 Tax=Puniceibacterium sp. IMCC21224 TaxID=1618204 RepID=UPI00064DE6C9|nr:penicillin-binding protein 1C [Puniceibacterium sp. IMCC21224]KMK65935.1 penicillin-binding protein 1C [Puniceibacterium sp. IMCC21224]